MINREVHRAAQRLFIAVSELPPESRAEFLDRECVGAETRELVEGMLSVDESADDFLDRSPFAAGTASERRRDRIRKLVDRSTFADRLEVEEEIAHGGMGTILRVRDTELRRTLAMKVIRGQTGAVSSGEVPGVADEVVARFLAEAEVTGQLEHPGIVPVHELGVDSEGRVYFTMPLVGGRTLLEVLAQVHETSSTWTLTRALGVLQKICDTMAFAHDAGVVHRDLKPANVMVGEFGEVYVMDWGLAQSEDDVGAGEQTVAATEMSGDADSGFTTRAGAVMGTAFYMSPEQALGDVDAVGAAADVYAVGAMLYHLLAGAAPYGDSTCADQALAELRMRAPRPIASVATGVSPELIAICEKAMARDPEDRYSGMADLARDLQAYLEGRVVRAHRTGAWVEFRKWIGRNRRVATAAAVAIATLLMGSIGIAAAERRSAVSARRAAVLQESFVLFHLEEEALALWPAVPAKVPAMREWLTTAERVLRTIDEAIDGISGEGETRLARQRSMRASVARIEMIVDDVRESAAFAARIETLSITGEEARAAWIDAIQAIDNSPHYNADPNRPFHLTPQIGLFPLGENPKTHLWEFWHVASGDRPVGNPTWNRDWTPADSDESPNCWELHERGADGKPASADSPPVSGTGTIFVLVPGSRDFPLGAQDVDPNEDNYEPTYRMARAEMPPGTFESLLPKRYEVHPFFVSKYEMTQGQWLRCFERSPSVMFPGRSRVRGSDVGWLHPVNYVDGVEASVRLGQLGMRIPTEEEWEYATRGGTRSRWWSGSDRASLDWAANLKWRFDFDTGTGAVGKLRPNPFGLHDVNGNVSEICFPRAAYVEALERENVDDGPHPLAIYRGGDYTVPPVFANSAAGLMRPLEQRHERVGVRPVRYLDAKPGVPAYTTRRLPE